MEYQRSRHKIAFLAALILSILLVSCNEAKTTPARTINASVLVELNQHEPRWFRDVKISTGTNGYQLLEIVTNQQIKSKWYPQYNAHFVTSVFGIENENSVYWAIYVWDEQFSTWRLSTSSADALVVEDGQIIAWARIDPQSEKYKHPSSTP